MGKQLFRRKFRLFSKFFTVKQQKVTGVDEQKSTAGTVPSKPVKQSPLENLSPKVQPKPAAVGQISVSQQSQQPQHRYKQSETQQAQTQYKQEGSFYSQKVGAGSIGCRTEPVGFAQTLPTGMSPMLGFEPMAQSQWGGSTAMLVTGRKDLQQAVDIEEIWSQPTVVLKPWEIQCGA